MILLIDSYDSFSYNLYQLVGALNPDIQVIRNDEMTVEEIRAMAPEPHPPLSRPGPAGGRGGPDGRGAAHWGARSPSWGCAWGTRPSARPWGAPSPTPSQLMHGKQSQVTLGPDLPPVSPAAPSRARVARYHSLAADPASLPACLQVTAATDDGEVMAVQPQGLPHLRPAVSPGIHSDPRRQDHAAKLSSRRCDR